MRRPAFDVCILLLILASVYLLAEEIVLPEGSPDHARAVLAGEIITWIFVVELVIRFVAMKRRKRFFQEYWIDILAVLPLLRVFRFFRFLRLLRLLRLFRVATLISSNSRVFQFLLKRRAAEYLLLTFLITFALVFGTLGLSHFTEAGSGINRLAEAFWVTIFSLVAGEHVNQFPPSTGAKVVSLFIQFCGLGFFAVMTGTVSAVMIEKLKEGAVLRRMMLEDLEGHVLICGWNSGVETIMRELQCSKEFRDRDLVVIADREELPPLDLPDPARVRLLQDDFTRAEVLLKANVVKASVAVIVSDTLGRSRQDADARTVLAALTIEKLNPEVHTCAELSNAMNETHLRMGGVNEVIITRNLAGHLLAQAALHPANSHLLQELLKPSEGGTLWPHATPEHLVGQPFAKILTPFCEKYGAVPVAVETAAGQIFVNPMERLLVADDRLLCVDSGLHLKR